MRSTTPRIALILTLFALALAPAIAQQGGGPPHRGMHGGPGGDGQGMGMMMGRFADEIGLTADQRAQMRAITAKYMGGDLGTAMDSLRAAHKALATSIHDATATDDQVTAAAKQVSALDEKIAVIRHHMANEINAILTPDQQKKAQELHSQMPMGGPGGPPPMEPPAGL